MKQNIIQERTFDFAVKSVDLYKKLNVNNEFVLSKQFIRSATSMGANVEEAIAGFSRKDFAYKMGIASREARETHYWLRVLEAGEFIEYDYSELLDEARQLKLILSSIVKSTQQGLK
jgi:four helix bundle protein